MGNSSTSWILGAAVVVVAFVGFAAFRSSSTPEPRAVPTVAIVPLVPPPRTPAALVISIASSNTKEAWLHGAVRAFTAASQLGGELRVEGQPVEVQILQETVDGKPVDYRSGTMVNDTLAGKIQPTILSPGEESWLAKFKDEWKLKHGTNPVPAAAPLLVRTPLVLAMWQSRARALGCFPDPGPGCTWERLRALARDPSGWKSHGHAQWGRFTIGYGYFGESNSGTLAVVAMCMVGAGKSRGLEVADVGVSTGCGRFVGEVERAKFHSGKSDLWLLERMVLGGPDYLDAVVTYESNVVAANRAHLGELREPLVAVYPQDGTVLVGHPFAILEGAPWVTKQQAVAARLFGKFLLSREQQEAVLEAGLRPVDPSVKVGAPLDSTLGANPQAKLVPLEVPDPRVLEQLGEVWHRVKKHAVVTLLFDKSGSMAEAGKIGAAIKGAQGFVRRLDNEDHLQWMPFDDVVYRDGARGPRSEVGEQLAQEIAGTRTSGGTALYDAVVTAFDELETQRGQGKDDLRYGIVLLSDGQDTHSHATLAELQERLRSHEGDPTSVQIHAIAIGADADERVLTRIATAAHGRYWKGQTEGDLARIYQEIATYW